MTRRHPPIPGTSPDVTSGTHGFLAPWRMVEKKAMTAARRRLIVTDLREHFSVSQRRASRALDLPRSSLRYAPVARDEQAALARRIEELAGAHPRFGYRRTWALLVRECWSVNKKAVRRLWRLSGLKLAGP